GQAAAARCESGSPTPPKLVLPGPTWFSRQRAACLSYAARSTVTHETNGVTGMPFPPFPIPCGDECDSRAARLATGGPRRGQPLRWYTIRRDCDGITHPGKGSAGEGRLAQAGHGFDHPEERSAAQDRGAAGGGGGPAAGG